MIDAKKWICMGCGLMYQQARGWPPRDIAPGTPWADVPSDWTCPNCNAPKGDYEPVMTD